MEAEYRRRYLDDVLADMLPEVSGVLLTGPRSCGKTTTAIRHAGAVLRLDVPGTAAAVAADPDLALASESTRPLLIDEWQEVPEVLGAVKRGVDQNPAAGQFILTGSVRSQSSSRMWPGTGRLIRIPMAPLAQREIAGFEGSVSDLFLHRLFGRGEPDLSTSALTLTDYVHLTVQGGFPEVLRLASARARRAWLDSYVEQLLVRDISELGEGVDPIRLRQYVDVLAVNTAGVLAQSALAQSASITVKTSERYDQLLAEVGIIDNPQPWGRNRLARIEKRPKRIIVDSGLAVAAARLDEGTILHDGTLLGRFLEGFVFSQLRAEVLAAEDRMALHHVRGLNGRHEIDFVIEGSGGRVLGIEVKASTSVVERDARHLAWLRDSIGQDFVGGLVLHAGPNAYPLDDRLWAMPISSLWDG